MPGKRSVVADAGASYSAHPNHEVRVLYDLVIKVIGSRVGAEKLFRHLIAEDERVTGSNLRDRLRFMLKQEPEIPGFTERQRQQLKAALEFGDRLTRSFPLEGEVMDDPAVAASFIQPIIGWEPVECFVVLALDVKHRYLSSQVISRGAIAETMSHPRDIFGAIIRANGARGIIAHNHPSGMTTPSDEDRTLTRHLLSASTVMCVPILDHLIVSKGSWESMRQITNLWLGYEVD